MGIRQSPPKGDGTGFAFQLEVWPPAGLNNPQPNRTHQQGPQPMATKQGEKIIGIDLGTTNSV
ncbi:MAG: hypothetical protein ACOYK7_12310, partial [Pirellulales bacterium]